MITDFGLARVRDDLGLTATTTGAIIGSIPYMAPEQITGPKEAVGPGSDIYALGVIFYHMLTGSMPFPGLTSEAMIRKIVHDQPDSVRSRRATVPVDLATICERCLRKKPHQRFASAAELRDDLVRFRNGQKIEARPMPRWEKAVNWCRKYPTVTVAMLAGVSFMGVQGYQVRELRRVNADLTEAKKQADANLTLANDRNRVVQRYYYDRRLIDAQAAVADHDVLARPTASSCGITCGGNRGRKWNGFR
jgi:serine/threonine protein kinase